MNSLSDQRLNRTITDEQGSCRLNREELLKHMLGDANLLAEMVQTFLSELATHIGNLESAVNSGNARKIYVAAHTFKGAVSNFAAPLATESVARLEQMGRSGDLSSAATEFAVLRQEIAHLKPLLLAACEEVGQ